MIIFPPSYSIQYPKQPNESDFDSGAYGKNGHNAILFFSVQVLLPIAQRLKRFSEVENQYNFGFMYKTTTRRIQELCDGSNMQHGSVIQTNFILYNVFLLRSLLLQ